MEKFIATGQSIKKTRSGRSIHTDPPEIPMKRRRPGVEKFQEGSASRVLKSDSDIWLVGYPLPDINSSGLPTTRQVYQHFRSIKNQAGDPKAAVARLRQEDPRFLRMGFLDIIATKTIDSVEYFWSKASFKTKPPQKARQMVLNIHDRWQNLNKLRHRSGDEETAEGKRRAEFSEKLDELFDLNVNDWRKVVKASRSAAAAEEDIAYMEALLAGSMKPLGSLDHVHRARHKRIEARAVAQQTARYREEMEKQTRFVSHTPDSTDDLINEQHEHDPDYIGPSPCSSRTGEINLTLPRNFITSPILTEAADRSKASNNLVAMLSVALLKIGKAKSDDIILSRDTIRRWRMKNRSQGAAQIKADYVADIGNNDVHLGLHWDEKLMAMTTGEKMEQLAIVASGGSYPEGKLLGAIPIRNGTGKTMAEKVYEIGTDWCVLDSTVSLIFDTTSSNTGILQGAATRLEVMINRKLFWLACRHHILELVVAAAWKSMFGDDQSSDHLRFKELQEKWNSLDREVPIRIDLRLGPEMTRRKDRIIKVMKDFLVERNSKGLIPRADYAESLRLAIMMLDGWDKGKFSWRQPGAFHKARWLAHILYAPKMLAFGEQMGYEPDFIDKLKVFVTFTSLYYVPYWILAPRGIDAAVHDLEFSKTLFQLCAEVEFTELANAALRTFRRHTWYLCSETVIFSLFSALVSPDEKSTIAKKLLAVDIPAEFVPGKPQLPTIHQRSELSDFVNENSWFLFHVLDVQCTWLATPPETWEQNDCFVKVQNYLRHMKVVNDSAERGIKLCSEFIQILTKNEDNRQEMLQVVESHRYRVKERTKRALFQTL